RPYAVRCCHARPLQYKTTVDRATTAAHFPAGLSNFFQRAMMNASTPITQIMRAGKRLPLPGSREADAARTSTVVTAPIIDQTMSFGLVLLVKRKPAPPTINQIYGSMIKTRSP